jgi:hypothetical protein
MKELNRLVKYLNELIAQGHCIFYEYSGHVYWFEIRIVESDKEYGTEIYHTTICLSNFDNTFATNTVVKNNATKVMAEIGEVIEYKNKAIKKAKEKQRIDEIAKLNELKEKYESKKDI